MAHLKREIVINDYSIVTYDGRKIKPWNKAALAKLDFVSPFVASYDTKEKDKDGNKIEGYIDLLGRVSDEYPKSIDYLARLFKIKSFKTEDVTNYLNSIRSIPTQHFADKSFGEAVIRLSADALRYVVEDMEITRKPLDPKDVENVMKEIRYIVSEKTTTAENENDLYNEANDFLDDIISE